MYHVITGKGKEPTTTTTTTTTTTAAVEAETTTPPEPVVVPSETIYLQIMEFLLDAKATPVKRSVLSCRSGVLMFINNWQPI